MESNIALNHNANDGPTLNKHQMKIKEEREKKRKRAHFGTRASSKMFDLPSDRKDASQIPSQKDLTQTNKIQEKKMPWLERIIIAQNNK